MTRMTPDQLRRLAGELRTTARDLEGYAQALEAEGWESAMYPEGSLTVTLWRTFLPLGPQ